MSSARQLLEARKAKVLSDAQQQVAEIDHDNEVLVSKAG